MLCLNNFGKKLHGLSFVNGSMLSKGRPAFMLSQLASSSVRWSP
jgi:hypothetical protein